MQKTKHSLLFSAFALILNAGCGGASVTQSSTVDVEVGKLAERQYPNRVYIRGIGVSDAPSIQTALKEAKNAATQEIAATLWSEIRGQFRSRTADTNGIIEQELEETLVRNTRLDPRLNSLIVEVETLRRCDSALAS